MVGSLAASLGTNRALREVRLITLAQGIAVLLLALLAACSRGGDSDASPTGIPSPSVTATVDPTPGPALTLPAFSVDKAMEVVHALSVEVGPRVAGTDAERRAAEYLREELSSYGYAAELQPFTFESFEDLGSRLEMISPEAISIDARALGASPSGSVEAELVAAGLGRLQEIPTGSAGKILLIQRGEIPFSEKVGNAEAAGALGVVIYNNKAGLLNGQLSRPSGIPAAGISQIDGELLLARLQEGPVVVRLETNTRELTATSHNIVATPPDGSCSVVAGGHYDSVPEGPGANDNASGTAVVVEMARARAAAGQVGNVCYVLFGAEEIGLLGSAHYVDSLSPRELSGLKAMLNFDMLAVGTGWPLVGAPTISLIAANVADSLGIEHTVSAGLPENLGSDHQSFARVGVPSIIFNCFCDPNYHSPQDTFDFIQPERLLQAGQMGLGIIEELLQDGA